MIDPSWRWTDLEMGHELYCAGHLIQAGIATARATGDCSLLAVALRFADLIDDVFGNDPARGTDGSPEIEVVLAELYRQTGETRYLRLANTLTRRRGFGTFAGGRFDLDYYQDAEPVRDARGIVGHAVRALYLAAGVTDIYAETGDEALLASMLRQWDDLASAKSYLTGGIAPLGGETIDMGTGGSTEQQKLAWEWVEGMQQTSTMEHVTSLMYYLPTKPAVTDQVLKGGPEYTVFAKETQTARSRTTEYGANYPKVSQAIWTAIQAAITGTSSVSSALQTAQGTVSGVQQVSGG